MRSAVPSLDLDEKLRAGVRLYDSIHHEEKGVLWIAFTAAVILHIAVLLIHFPEMRRTTLSPQKRDVIVVRKYIPPPPPVERRQVPRRQLARRVPIPDPTPDEPEPIREPDPEPVELVIPPDVEILIGVPEPPPQTDSPLIAGVGDVTNPVLIEDSKVPPEYPEIARVARLEGNVILQAIIHRDGTVGNIEILRCNRPRMGFEEAAEAAVRQWRYEPATQNGRPVDVYFTVFVEFTLL
jgi:TonB family protein